MPKYITEKELEQTKDFLIRYIDKKESVPRPGTKNLINKMEKNIDQITKNLETITESHIGVKKDLEYMKISLDKIEKFIENADDRNRALFASKRTEYIVWVVLTALLTGIIGSVLKLVFITEIA